MRKIIVVTMLLMLFIAVDGNTQDSFLRKTCGNCHGKGKITQRDYRTNSVYFIWCSSCNGRGYFQSSTPTPTTVTREQLNQWLQDPKMVQLLKDNPENQKIFMGMLTPELQQVLRDKLAAIIETPPIPDFQMNGTVLVQYKGNGGNIIIPEGVTEIRQRAFEGCTSITSVTIPEGVTYIGLSAFHGCTNLSSIIIPASVTKIGQYAFSGCKRLTSITIPAGVTEIDAWAFEGCTSLTGITIPASVTKIAGTAFRGCTSLINITVTANNPNYASEGGILYNKAKDILIAYPSASGSIAIPVSVALIEAYAFSRCTGLTSITIPASVGYISNYAFEYCINLTSITFTEGSNKSKRFGMLVSPEGRDGTGGDTLRTAYNNDTTKSGTYTRTANGTTWTKQP